MCQCVFVFFFEIKIFCTYFTGCLVISIVHRERRITYFNENLFRVFLFVNNPQIIFRVFRINSVQILFTWVLAVKARRWGAQTARTALERHNGFASFLTQTFSTMSDRYFYFCKPTSLFSNDFLNNLWFVRHLVRISAGNDDNIISYR